MMAGGRLWTAEEIGHLKRRYPVVGPRKVADELGYSVEAVQSKAYVLGIRARGRHDEKGEAIGRIYANSGTAWTERDDAFLRRSYRALGAGVCVELLQRSAASIYARASKLGLQAAWKYTRAVWEARGDEIIAGIARAVAQELGVSVFAVVRRIGVLYDGGRITENEQE